MFFYTCFVLDVFVLDRFFFMWKYSLLLNIHSQLKGTLFFVAQFYSHLWLRQGCVWPTLRKYWMKYLLLLLNVEPTKVQSWETLDSFFLERRISEYFESKFYLFSFIYSLVVYFLKKMKSILENSFYLNFVKKVKCILKSLVLCYACFFVVWKCFLKMQPLING